MNLKLPVTVLAFTLTAIIAACFLPFAVAQDQPSVLELQKSPGLTAQGLVNARASDVPGRLVTMGPQSSLKLLARATEVGPHAAGSTIELTIALRLRNVSRLKSFLQQVQNPVSPVYHQWLTPEQFTARYGPTKDQVMRMVNFLKAQGINVKNVSPNRILIYTAAKTGVYDHAFGIGINDYKLNGRRFYSTTDSPKVPRDIAPLVANILGLDHGVQMHAHHFMKPWEGAASEGLSPNVAPPASLTNLGPLQIAHAYNWPDITDAANAADVSIAILTANSSWLAWNDSPHAFWDAFGLPDHTINVISVDGDNSNTDGMGETLLDVEMAGAMAPSAKLNVYVASDRNFSTFAQMYNQFVNDNTSDVMTTSWGGPETASPALFETGEQIFMQAAAQGISMFAAAGDHGASDGTTLNIVADFPSSSSYITAANGTQLTISDLVGTYGSEVVWKDADCFHQGAGSTGGAISRLFERPGWQRGQGLPQDVDMRMNSGIALTASCSHPMYIYTDNGWSVTAGTSAVAPMLAGLFAIAVSQNEGDRLGQSNSLIYADANVSYASDFHDVTIGNNGAFEAGPGWDHPTGWGSVDAASLLSNIAISGAKGTLKGTVTDAEGSLPVANARITVGNLQIVSADDGTYSTVLPTGDVTVTVSAFGYGETSASVHIGDGGTVTQNFALTAGPKARLSGKVNDGSGHDYGLYADVKVSTESFGPVAEIWTNPETGKYSVRLPKGFDYKVHVATALDGYNTASANITLSGDKTKDFALPVTNTCSAPGYSFLGPGGFSEDFNGSVFPPDGWTAINVIPGSPLKWKLNTGYDQNNITGGTGTAADVRGASFPDGYFGPFDNSLITPPIDVDSLNGTILKYKANFGNPTNTTNLDLDISTDAGNTWTTILHWQEEHGEQYNLPGENVRVNLAPYVNAGGAFQLRWRHYKDSVSYYYAQIDDVVIGGCAPLPGGLVMGQVTDGNTDKGIVGAHVGNGHGVGVDTVNNPADKNSDHPNPFYLFFLPKGAYTLTATDNNYSAATDQVRVANNQVVRKDFTLKTAQFKTMPDTLTLHVMANNSATVSFAIRNTGGGAGSYRIFPVNSAPSTASSATNQAGRVVRIPVKHPAWMTASFPWIRSQASRLRHALSTGGEVEGAIPRVGDAWQAIAPYPMELGDVTVARDSATGKLYAMGGFGSDGVVAAAYVYDPEASNWSPIADAPVARDAPVSAFINGKYYVFNGWDSSDAGPVAEVDIYDPGTNNWSQGTPNPAPAGGGSAIAVLNGSVYIVGGCRTGACNTRLSTVQIYNPALDSWSLAADYPRAVTFAACGAIRGKLYCAGGSSEGQGTLTAGYVYSSVSNSWAPIADMPIESGLAGSFYAAANGLLLIAGGFSDTDITNQAVAYDPGADSWTDFPPLNMPVTRGGSACGFYQVGGINSAFLLSSVTAGATVLPSYDRNCGKLPSIPWLVLAPTQGTLSAGAEATVALTVDGTGQKAFTTSEAYLSIANNTPYGSLAVPLTVHWEPQPVGLTMTGKASPDLINKGGNITYSLMVQNEKTSDHGAASETMLTYGLPDGVSYVASSGDASCIAPTGGTSSTPAAATGVRPGTVTCDFGTLAQGATKTVTIAVKADQPGTLTSHFEVSAREPNDSDEAALDLETTVIGDADVGVSLADATVKQGKQVTVPVKISNAGPDTATDVKLKLSTGGTIAVAGADSDGGSCSTSSSSSYECEVGEVASGQSVTVELTVTGEKTGSGSLTAQVLTSARDGADSNNVATASVTVKSSGGGGGSLGWLVLAALLGLGLTAAARRHLR